MPHGEGYFSPAVGRGGPLHAAAWNNPAGRGPAAWRGPPRPAGPRALRVPGRVVDASRDIGLPGVISGSPFRFREEGSPEVPPGGSKPTASPQSRPDLARRAGVPASTLRNWDADRGMPGLPVLLRLAGVLGVPVERFAEGVKDPAGLDLAPGPTPTKQGRAGKLPEAQVKPRERKTRRPRGG